MRRPYGVVKTILWYLIAVPALLAMAVLAEAIGWLRAPDDFFARVPGSQALLLGICVALALAGLFLLVFAQFLVRRPSEAEIASMGEGVEADWAPLDHRAVEEMTARNRATMVGPAAWRGYRFRHIGASIGGGYAVSTPIRTMKQAWRSGQWWRNRAWRTGFLAAFGALCMLLGLFGIFIVLGPPLVRLICAVALLYALGNIIWAVIRA